MAIEQDDPPSPGNVVETSVCSDDVASVNQEEVSISPREEPVKKDVYNQPDHEIPVQKNGGHFDSSRSDESLLYVGESGLKNNSSSKTTTDLPANSDMEDNKPTAELKPQEELSSQPDSHEKETTSGEQTMDVTDGINREHSPQERQQTVSQRKTYDRNRASFPPPPPDYETAITRCVRLDPNPAGFVLMPVLPAGFSPAGGQPYWGDHVQHGALPPQPNNGFAHDGHFQQESGHDRIQDAPFEQDIYRHEPGLDHFSTLPPYSHDLGPDEVGHPAYEDRHFGDFPSRPPLYGSAENILDMKDPSVPLAEMSPQLSSSAMDISEYGRNSRSMDRKSALAGFLNRRKNLSGSWGSRTRQPRQSASSVFAGSAESIHDTQDDTSQRTMSLDRLNRHRPASKRTYGIRSSSLDRMLDDDGNGFVETDETNPDENQEEDTPQRTASLDRLDRQRTPSKRSYGIKTSSLHPSDNGRFDGNGDQITGESNEDGTPQRTGSLDRLNRQGSAYDRAKRVKAASLEEFRQSLKLLTLKKDKSPGSDVDQHQEQVNHEETRVPQEATQKTPVRKHLTPFIKFSPAFLEQERGKQIIPQSPTPTPTVTDGQLSRLDDARQRANQLEELLNSKRQKMEEAKEQVRKIHQNLEEELTKQKQVSANSRQGEESVEINFSKSKDGDEKSEQPNGTAEDNDWSTVQFGHQSISKSASHDNTDRKESGDDLFTKLDSKDEESHNVAKKLLLRAEGSHQNEPISHSFISFEGDDGPITPPPLRNDPLPELGVPENDYIPGNPFDLFLDSLGLPVMEGDWPEERRPSLSTIYEEDEPLTDSNATSVIDLTMEEGSLVAEDDEKEEMGPEEEEREDINEKKVSPVEATEAEEKVENLHPQERLENDKDKLEKDEDLAETSKKDAEVNIVKQVSKTETEEIHTTEEITVNGKGEKLEEKTEVNKVNMSEEPNDVVESTQSAQEDISEKDTTMEKSQIDATGGEKDSTKESLNEEPIDSVQHVDKKEEEGNDQTNTLPVMSDIPTKELDNAADEKDGLEEKITEESADSKVELQDEQNTKQAIEEDKCMAGDEKPQPVIKVMPKEEDASSEKEGTNTLENKENVTDEAKKDVADTPKEDAEKEDTGATKLTVRSQNDNAEQERKEASGIEENQKKEAVAQSDAVSIRTKETPKEEIDKSVAKTQEPIIENEQENNMRLQEEHNPKISVDGAKTNPKKMPVVELTINLKASEIGPDLLNELEKAKTPTSVTPVVQVSESPKVSKKTSRDKTKQSKGTTKSSKEPDKSKKNKNFMEEINALLEQTESTMVRRSTEITSVSEDLQNTAKTLFNLEVEEPVFTSPNTTSSSHDLSGSASSLDSTEEDKGHISLTSPERPSVESPERQPSVTTPERQSDSGNGSLNESPFSVRAETLEKSPPPLDSQKEIHKMTKQEGEDEKKQESVKDQTEKPTPIATKEVLETGKETLSKENQSENTTSSISGESTGKFETSHQKQDAEKDKVIPSDVINPKDNLEQKEPDTMSEPIKSSQDEESPSKESVPEEVIITYKKIDVQDNLKQSEPDMKSDETVLPSIERERPSQEMNTEQMQEINIESKKPCYEDEPKQKESDTMSNEATPHEVLEATQEIRKGTDTPTHDATKPPKTDVAEPNAKIPSESNEQKKAHTSRVEMNVPVQEKKAKLVSEDIKKDEGDVVKQEPDIISNMPKVARSVEMFESLLRSNNKKSTAKTNSVKIKPVPTDVQERNGVNKIADDAHPKAKAEDKKSRTVEPDVHKQSKQETTNSQPPDQVDDEGEVAEGIYTASLVYVGGNSFEESGEFSPRSFPNNESLEDDSSPIFSPTHKSTPREGIFKAQLVQVSSLSFEEEEESFGSEDSSNASIRSSPSYELVRDEKGWKGKPAPRHSTPTGQEDSSPGQEDNSLRRGRSMRRRSQRRSFEGSLWDDEDFKHKPALLRQDSPLHKPEPVRSPELDTSASSQKTSPSPKSKKSFKDFFRLGKKRSSSAHKATPKRTPGSEEEKVDALPTSILVERGSQSDTEDEPRGGLSLFYKTSKTKRKKRKGSVSSAGGERGCGAVSLGGKPGERRNSWAAGQGRFSNTAIPLAFNYGVDAQLRRGHTICWGTRVDVRKQWNSKRKQNVGKNSSSCSSLPTLLASSPRTVFHSASSIPPCPSIEEDASSNQSLIFESAL
ncbi:microtubule-associated protein futsch-like isoform X1 [Branchiostoma floridae]|uniref:Microtubule-associated protein futsch-like isoform X1 n=1 Tax=Branchiostoma floridae TaxID=7739 RepID=A0A9J7LUF8_BRAFL|nr:microtubule-associated protein futsch-like isoform X1 [Branchiostoma floridae]